VIDIVERLNDVRFAAPAWMRPVVDEAADEIGRLRFRIAVYTAGVSAARETKTLTDAEREAVERASDLIDNKTCGDSSTLRGLLERLK
jgi:hypothetical protein